jgi:hypothetical protein
MPDGRVHSGSGDVTNDGWLPDQKNADASRRLLFRGARPTISNAPSSAGGTSFTVSAPDQSAIAR